MKIYSLYIITNLLNDKKYVGITSQKPEIRWSEHLRSKKGCNCLIRAFNKYNRDNFKFEVIYQTLDIDDINSKEIYFIKELNTIAPHGYNLIIGGKFHEKSEITRQNLSKSLKGVDRSNLKKPLLRINKTTKEIFEYDSLKSAINDGFNGRSIRSCIKNERSNITHKGFYWCYKQDFINFKFKEPIRTYRKIKSIDLTTGEVRIYNSVKEATSEYSLHIFNILKTNKPYKNKIWEYC